jgi:hypothetical protein
MTSEARFTMRRLLTFILAGDRRSGKGLVCAGCAQGPGCARRYSS